VFVICFRIGTGRVDNTNPMVRRSIERVELQWIGSGIDNIVVRSGRDKYGKTRTYLRTDAIEDCDAIPLLYAEELIKFVDLHPDILPGLQRHDNELAVFSRI
jgi:hypothetical protein